MAMNSAAFALTVEIPDRNLHNAIREALNLPAGDPITHVAMRSLISLDVADLGIADLTGLEHATELTWLAIPGNHITDLTPIAALTHLEALLMWVESRRRSNASFQFTSTATH